MREIFLSASVPLPDRGDFYRDFDPFLLQTAVRELVGAVIKDRRIVWGGHPAITPMIAAICADLGVEYQNQVLLYQSNWFERKFPTENQLFVNRTYTPALSDLSSSLLRMRVEMLARPDIDAAVFVGGMEGIFDEFRLFEKLKPNATAIALAAPGGAAARLKRMSSSTFVTYYEGTNFRRIFHEHLLSAAPSST